jgi:hypothetical protein
MSELLDGLARSLAEPMPRRRALRVLTVTLAGAMLSGRAVMTAAATDSAGCPNPGDLFCGGCENVNGLNYGDVCCPGPDASRYWECDCKKGPGGYNGCKRKTGCDVSCGSGCCDSTTEHCCPSGYCFPKESACCGNGACAAGTHCCHAFTAYGELKSGVGALCCPDGWECCGTRCCAPGTHCIDQTGKVADPAARGVQANACEGGVRNSERATHPVPWAKTVPAPPSN